MAPSNTPPFSPRQSKEAEMFQRPNDTTLEERAERVRDQERREEQFEIVRRPPMGDVEGGGGRR